MRRSACLATRGKGLTSSIRPARKSCCAGRRRTCCAPRDISDAELKRIAAAARERTIAEHTAERRVIELERILEDYMWGIIPAAGKGSRIQPLAFSKELLPVGSRYDGADGAPA